MRHAFAVVGLMLAFGLAACGIMPGAAPRRGRDVVLRPDATVR